HTPALHTLSLHDALPILLLVIQYVPGRQQEDHHLVLLQLLVREDAVRILGPEDREIMELRELLDGRHARVDRVVMPPVRLGEQHRVELLPQRERGGNQTKQENNRQTSKGCHRGEERYANTAEEQPSMIPADEQISLPRVPYRSFCLASSKQIPHN